MNDYLVLPVKIGCDSNLSKKKCKKQKNEKIFIHL